MLRQRYTLSQLQSGHCHLLLDYMHRVFGEPSDICTDCGASPQYVNHFFACNAHLTDLTPGDLCWNPVRSIRAFSYLATGTLTDLTTGLVGSNNNSLQVVKLSGLQTCKLLSTHPSKSFLRRFYTRTLALLQSIHVRCVLAVLQVVG